MAKRVWTLNVKISNSFSENLFKNLKNTLDLGHNIQHCSNFLSANTSDHNTADKLEFESSSQLELENKDQRLGGTTQKQRQESIKDPDPQTSASLDKESVETRNR